MHGTLLRDSDSDAGISLPCGCCAEACTCSAAAEIHGGARRLRDQFHERSVRDLCESDGLSATICQCADELDIKLNRYFAGEWFPSARDRSAANLLAGATLLTALCAGVEYRYSEDLWDGHSAECWL